MIEYILRAVDMRNVNRGDTKDKKNMSRSDRNEIIRKVRNEIEEKMITKPTLRYPVDRHIASNLHTLKSTQEGLRAIEEIYKLVKEDYNYMDAQPGEESDDGDGLPGNEDLRLLIRSAATRWRSRVADDANSDDDSDAEESDDGDGYKTADEIEIEARFRFK